MRLAIFSDIHGNLDALEAFIRHAADRSVARYICLGDIIGYGANPCECFDRLSALPDLQTILGNHDAAAIWQASPYDMSPNASKAILWTMDQLEDSHTDRIRTLEALIKTEEMVFCHANPYNPSGWRYVITWFHALRSFFASPGRLTFVGHTHRPRVIVRKDRFKIEMSDPPENGVLHLNPTHRYIINCGSIGQPRDGNPDAGYVIFDTESDQIEFVRFAYDIESAARRIQDAGLPKYLAQRLFRGR